MQTWWEGERIMQLPFNTRSQGSAHGRACKVDEHTHTHSCEGVKISMTNQKDLETCSQWGTKGWTGQEWGLQIDRHLSDRKKHEKRKWGRVTIWEQTCCWGKKKKRWELRAKSDDCSCQINLSTQVHCVLVFCYDNVCTAITLLKICY